MDALFAGRNIASVHVATNAEGYHLICSALDAMPRGLLFANIPEFDQSWGHRNDVSGFLGGLRELDAALPGMLGRVREEDLVIFTADHGNDPTTPSTDHSRERVPFLCMVPAPALSPWGSARALRISAKRWRSISGPPRWTPAARSWGRFSMPDAMLEAARAVQRLAYAPYSGYRVGAALEGADGRVFVGCNVENASYGLTICAERAALVSAVAAGVRQFRRIVVVSDSDPPASPGGEMRPGGVRRGDRTVKPLPKKG